MVLEKQRQSFIGGGMQSSREYSENIAQEMDAFIKNSLDEHYLSVKKRLEEYKQAIEDIVELLYAKENISGKQVREIIEKFEQDNNLESKLQELSESDKQHQEDSEKRED
jgi:cell division protease FtsH